MANNPNHLTNNGSQIYFDKRFNNINAVIPGADNSHLHIAWDILGNINHTDFTFPNGLKVNVNPNVANNFGSFLGKFGK